MTQTFRSHSDRSAQSTELREATGGDGGGGRRGLFCCMALKASSSPYDPNGGLSLCVLPFCAVNLLFVTVAVRAFWLSLV